MNNRAGRRSEGALARREKRLAYSLLLPTFALVLAVILLPLLANFWISFKPVTLADLRPPQLIVKEQLRGKLTVEGDNARIEYRFRNSSIKYPLGEVSFTDSLPDGVRVTGLDEACRLDEFAAQLACDLGDLDAKARGRIRIEIEAVAADPTGALLFGLFAAQIMQKAFFGRPVIRGLLLFPYVAPVIAVAFSWVVLFDPFSGAVNAMLQQMDVASGPINFFGQRMIEVSFFGVAFNLPMALTMVILFEVWRYFPLSFLFILARMQSIPSDIYEAAEIDGATPMQQFRFLSLPHIAGILAVLFLLRFIWTFNKFDDIFLLTGGNAGTRTLTVNVYEQAFAISNLGAGAAVAVVIFALLLVFSVIFIRFSPKDAG
jgi:multiple sugar transport system permease protein